MTMEPEAQTAAFELPPELPVLPLRGNVVYPFTVAPLTIGQERSGQLVDAVMRGNRLLAVVAQRVAEMENPGPADLYSVGTAARIALKGLKPSALPADGELEFSGGQDSIRVNLARGRVLDFEYTCSGS